MEHEMLPECKQWLVMLTESNTKAQDCIDSLAVLVNNHYTELSKNQSEMKTDISWIKKVMEKWWALLIIMAGGSGGASALVNYLTN